MMGGVNQDPHFQQLLSEAAAQARPHRLLFVFASVEAPERATPEQRARFEAGRGGVLTPLMCVDKAPGDLADFDSLREEARIAGPPWQVVLAAALPGEGGEPPDQGRIDKALHLMVQHVAEGRADRFAAYDVDGRPLNFF